MKKRANRVVGASSPPRLGSPLDGRGPGTCDACATLTNQANQISVEGLLQPAFGSRIRGRNAGPDAPQRKSRAVDRFWTVRQITELLLVCDRTLFRWTERKKLIAHQFGGAIRIAEHDLFDFIARARRAGAPLVHPCDDCFYIAADVAEMLNVCLRTIRRHIKSGVLIAHDFDGLIRISESDLRDFCERSRRK